MQPTLESEAERLDTIPTEAECKAAARAATDLRCALRKLRAFAAAVGISPDIGLSSLQADIVDAVDWTAKEMLKAHKENKR